MEIQRELREHLALVGIALLAVTFGVVVVYGAVTGVSTRWIEDLILASVLIVWGSQIIGRQRSDSLRAVAGGLLIIAGVLRAAVTLLPIAPESTPIPEVFLLIGLVVYLYDELIR